jgi:hypothetical protein
MKKPMKSMKRSVTKSDRPGVHRVVKDSGKDGRSGSTKRERRLEKEKL